MDAVKPYLAFLTDHVYVFVFIVAVIDSTGCPFPGRLLLITAGALSAGGPDTTWVVLLAASGALVGDHVLYLAGWLGGDKLLAFYCRWTMGSGRCIRKTQEYFRRFRGLTIVIGRFVAGVRIFASALAGSGAIPYYQFLLFDMIGGLLWATIFVLLGYVLGDHAIRLMARYGDVVLVVIAVMLLTLGGIVVYRLWKRRRHGAAAMARGRPRPEAPTT